MAPTWLWTPVPGSEKPRRPGHRDPYSAERGSARQWLGMEPCTETLGCRVGLQGLRRERIPKCAPKKAGKGFGWEPGPSLLQAVAHQQVQGRSTASRGQNLPGRSASLTPGSARPLLAGSASLGRCRAPAPDAGRRRPRPSLGSWRPGVCKGRGPRACERNSTFTHQMSWIQTHEDTEKYTETESQTQYTRTHTHPNPTKL